MLLLGETLSGLYVLNDVAQVGPLTDSVPARIANMIDAMHSLIWRVMLAGIALHLLAIATYAAAKGQNLLTPMVTGRKSLPPGIPPPHIASAAHALAVLSASAVVAAALINFV
jgi:hypothetical protein